MKQGARDIRIHPTAIIGSPPEHRDHKSGDSYSEPKVHREARISAFVTVDGGLESHPPTRIGRSMLMAHTHVGHNAIVGNDCELAPGTVLGGHVKVGNGVRFGINCCVRPFITIGDGARIGAGAVVVSNVPAGKVFVGNPAREMGSSPTSPDFLKRLDERVSALEPTGWEGSD